MDDDIAVLILTIFWLPRVSHKHETLYNKVKLSKRVKDAELNKIELDNELF